ncbi:hypothetical protein [Desulforamulus hydrothermalis]|uniref:Uncharacterized protein n=1 Tax=Desulforamulus hydrothermalis Lam5 = DSM 18033 TaxID=1121428 RepID=K8E9K7_9FIRM|nr:hypothetical protein [Desulforamulus hydrothermalis]CCO08263.1 hypothetical protein DESHY_20132 [Desulforamulus hydrothermalis Lam5 = DSM 18033]SHH37122.1 hypothetical protein SAMN02745177_02326 [Desulforamulus hydrothermalis Lam5 = DSM 18033]
MAELNSYDMTPTEKKLLKTMRTKLGTKNLYQFSKKVLELSEREQGLYKPEEVDKVVFSVVNEVYRARSLYPRFASAHEGYAVILEELDEAWNEIKVNNTKRAKAEMVQVAAMAIRFLLDITD